MKTEEMKTMANIVKEMNENYVDLLQAIKGTIKEVKSTRKLWRDRNQSRRIKLSLTLIVFPKPTPISETIDSCLVDAGAVQNRIRSRTIYVEDVRKTFHDVFKDMWTTTHSLRI